MTNNGQAKVTRTAIIDPDLIDPMAELIRETIKNGGEVTITLRGKQPGDDVGEGDEEMVDD